jgi:hypothetical protein
MPLPQSFFVLACMLVLLFSCQHAHAPAAPHLLLAAVGRLCEKCDGKCPICDSYVRPCTLVRLCDECNYGSYQASSFLPCRVCSACPGMHAPRILQGESEDIAVRAGPLCDLRWPWHLGCILLQGVLPAGERQRWLPKDSQSWVIKDGPVL